MTLAPPRTASCASAQSRSTATPMPAGPSAIGQVMSSTSARSPPQSSARITAASSFESTGCSSTSCGEASAPCSSRFSSGPRPVRRLITTYSRTGSIAGFVTWANRCLKYEYRLGAFSEKRARATSLPIDPVGSFASRAIGESTTRRSSCE